jgi:hypothetical protein
MANDQLGTAELGLLGMGRGGAPTEADIQNGIDRAMRGVTADRYNPNALGPPQAVRVAGAPTVTTVGERGWQPAQPLGPPGGESSQRAIKAMADHFLPSGRVERLRELWAKLRPDQQAELLAANPAMKA